MPKTQRAESSRNLPLALELLSADHRKVERLFAEYERMKEAEDDSRVALAQRVCTEITIHAQVEEDLLYPWLRENMDDTEMVAEALVEHASAKQLIAEIMGAGEADEAYDAKVKVLSEYIKHHVKEEENEIFPEVSSEQEELDELGQELAARKAELMEEAGISGEAEEMPEVPAGARQGRQAQRATQRGSR